MSLISFAGFAGFAVAVAVVAVIGSTSSDDGQGHDHNRPGHGEHAHGSHHVVSGSGQADPAQIESIRAAMANYQDIDTARADGWDQELPDDPETGAHFARSVDAEEATRLDLAHPDYLMYSRIGRPDWQLVAVAYVVDQADSPDPPTELQGAAYHQHRWNCVVDGEELDEDDVGTVSRGDCRARHGEWSPGGVWMTHVWLIDNPAGIFAETNPALA